MFIYWNKSKQKRFASAETHRKPSVIDDANTVRGFTAAPTSCIPRWQLGKKNARYKTTNSQENPRNIWASDPAFQRFPSKKIPAVNSVLLADSVEEKNLKTKKEKKNQSPLFWFGRLHQPKRSRTVTVEVASGPDVIECDGGEKKNLMTELKGIKHEWGSNIKQTN